jgi:hypothetical protein
MRRYQPMWENGQTVGPQERDCENRYLAIAPYVPEGARVLDFGAFTGYFSHRLADERNARCLAVAPEALPHYGIETINRTLNAEELRALGRFDVALGLSVLHHCEPWQDYFNALCDAADTVIVEVPHRDEWFHHCPADKVRAIADGVQGPVICETLGYQGVLLRPTVLVKGRLLQPGGSA